MLEKARSEKPLPVIVISSPPLVQPDIGQIVACIGLENCKLSSKSSKIDVFSNIGDAKMVNSKAVTSHVRIRSPHLIL